MTNHIDATAILDRFERERYTVREIEDHESLGDYRHLIENAYEPLGFMHSDLLPGPESECFELRYDTRLVAVFRLTPVLCGDSPYFLLSPFSSKATPKRLLEVNNVVVDTDFRATIVLGLILESCATIAMRREFDYVVGITRQQTLRYFVDFGVIPIDHEPLHLLGREDILDFVIYYDLTSEDSRNYVRQRSIRYFHQQKVMCSISLKYGVHSRASVVASSVAV